MKVGPSKCTVACMDLCHPSAAKVRRSVKGPLIVEPTEGLEISKQAPASTFVLHLARDWPQFHTRRASQSLQRKGTRVAPGRTQGQGGCSGYEQNDYTPPRTTLAEVQKKEHRSVQVAVARYCEKLGDRGVVIVHNSGHRSLQEVRSYPDGLGQLHWATSQGQPTAN